MPVQETIALVKKFLRLTLKTKASGKHPSVLPYWKRSTPAATILMWNLYIHMKNKKYRVSRATVYNTLELLVSCDLVTKHQFGKNMAQFEKSYGYKQHDHIICIDCGKVVEFCDPRIQQIQSMMGDILKFDIKHHSLNLYGNCIKLRDGFCDRKAQ
jgi:Fur family ferric uptake transcriptional regulator